MITWRQRVGLRLWWARTAAKMDVYEMAEELGIDRRTVQRIEAGEGPAGKYVDRWLEVTRCRISLSLERNDEA